MSFSGAIKPPLGALCVALFLASIAGPAAAQGPPAGYYDGVDDSDAATLRATLHATIDDHTRFPYTSGSTDTWNILELAMEDPADSGSIVDVYKNASYPKQGGGNSFYNREHTWPNSYGFPDDGSTNYPYTDCHQLFLCDISYNSARENKPFRTCSPGCAEYATVGGGSGTYPGNSNWTSGSQSLGTWETWQGRRGDVARGLFYLDVRYEGGTHGVTGATEPDLVLTDVQALISGSATGNNERIAYMGELQVLLAWHLEDPVDDVERLKNDVVFSFQGNRNPFIDHPEWVACLHLDECATDFTPYCFGAAGLCPCGNDDPAAGCANASGSGALLQQTLGGTSVAADDLVLSVSGVPVNQFGIVYMGGAEISLPFGDGLRCIGAGGAGTFRFPVRDSGLAGVIVEGPGLVAFSVANFGAAGSVAAGETWRFQGWYRDPSGPCGSAFNLSNGLAVTFSP